MLCLTLDARTMKENKAILRRNMDYVSIVELRADMLASSEYDKAMSFPSEVDIPVILTVRRICDGGRFGGAEVDRKTLVERLSEAPFSYVDLEVDARFFSIEQRLSERGVNIIRSLHDFSGIPNDLPELARAIASCGQIPKLAVTVNTKEDLDQVFHLGKTLSDVQRKIIVGMGPFVIQTRIRYHELGSMLTFCSESDPNGIGLPSPKELRRLSDQSFSAMP